MSPIGAGGAYHVSPVPVYAGNNRSFHVGIPRSLQGVRRRRSLLLPCAPSGVGLLTKNQLRIGNRVLGGASGYLGGGSPGYLLGGASGYLGEVPLVTRGEVSLVTWGVS